MDLLCFFLPCVCYVYVRVCLYVLCGHLLGKGWPFGSRLWCLTVSLYLSHLYPGSGVVLDCIDSWSLHPYLLCLKVSSNRLEKPDSWFTRYSLHHCSASNPRSAVGNVSGYRCVSDCNSRGREFDPGPVPYFHGDWSWNNFYGQAPPFRWFIQEGLLSVASESMCTNYWLSACSSLPSKKVWLGELTVPQWP